MTDAERIMVKTFINSRLEIAFQRLKDNPAYVKHCRAQDKSAVVVDELLNALSKDDRITIRRHYEGETEKESFELNETYLQGLKDCIRVLAFLNAFETELYL